jgi:hypothetical protein
MVMGKLLKIVARILKMHLLLVGMSIWSSVHEISYLATMVE